MTVRALKAGAANFLTKPFDADDLLNSIHQCMKVAALEHRTRTLEQSLKSARSELYERYGFEQIIGRSPVLRETLTRAAQVAPTETTVLITGESGTGKELVARAIHHASPRADGPFVAVNCAALPDTLLESELFGHERGAFTGADRQKPGRFELAARGTLFLDEIGELSPAVQAKLLRVLQEREFQRVGGTATLKADVRVIAATNRDLTAEMAAGRFRSDLFYRLGVFDVHLPALRERGDDVLLLADSFIRSLATKMGKGDVTLSRDARELLRGHAWPGNIRELQNAIERALITCEGTLVTAAHLAIPLPSEQIRPTGSPEAGAAGGLHGAGRARAQGHHRRAPAYPWAQGTRRRAPRPHAVSTLQPPEALPHRGVSRIARVADGASRHPPPFAVRPRTPTCGSARRCAHINIRSSPLESLHPTFRHLRRCDDLAASMQF